jgi:ribosome-associated translation inhibitor RaiA
MQRIIELKHVAPQAHVRQLLDELIDRLERQLKHFPQESVSIHVLFEENGTHQLFRTALTCHIPGRIIAAHDEGRDPGRTIREAFAEVRRQLEKRRTVMARGREKLR